jgi:ribosome maturation factor RimP
MERAELENLIEPLLKERGFELVDLESSRQGKRLLLRFFIDRLEQGITVGELAEVNQELSSLLDLESRLNESYVLEVSSPGLDRRVRKLKDFLKYLNRELEVESTEKIGDRRHFRGKLVAADSQGVTLVMDAQSVFIPHDKIKRANLQYRFE